MITKQQALEFIYELSQKTEIMLDVSCGEMQFNRICDGDYSYTSFANESTLESTVTKCIKEHMDAVMNYVDKIPINIDMLEVGQTYRLGTGETLYLKDITEYKLIFTHTKNNIIFGIDKEDIREIYKVQGE